MGKTDQLPADVSSSPTYWFCILEQSRLSGNFQAAADAKRELKRLGVDVRYRLSASAAEGSHRG